ncbi:MAG TPA: energy transducer TonB [Opitutus sp.]|nr:energy transducer TonB [Opitutus sp.]
MPWPRPLRRVLLALALNAPAAAVLPGQTILVVKHDGKPAQVVAARGARPLIEDHGKLTVASGNEFALLKTKQFLPVFVAVRNIRVRTSYTQMDGAGAINNEFHFHGDFSSAYPLQDVFVVFELHQENGGRNLFLYELGRLQPNDPHDLELVVPVSFRVGSGHFVLHVYSQGLEVLNSQQPFDQREAALDRIVADRVRHRKDGPPAPFIGPPPEYPEKLKKNGVAGQAVIHLRILPNGAVADPAVVSATDPAFGESAVAALRQWRFYPEIKQGRAVGATVNMPLDFVPPHKP